MKPPRSARRVENVVVFKRTGSEIRMTEGRDHWWHELMETVDADCPADELDSEHPLYILYTSGTTGKPKGILHTTGGYLTQARIHDKMVFDLKDEDIYWCTADIGWVTGHSYVVYGPLCQRRDRVDVRRRAESSRLRPLLGHHRAAQDHHLLHRPDRDPRVHQMGRAISAETRSFVPAAARAPSASRSTPKRGCGITR